MLIALRGLLTLACNGRVTLALQQRCFDHVGILADLESFCWKSGTTLSLNQLLSDPWKHCKDAQGRQGHVEVKLLSENHRKLRLCEVYKSN